MWLLFGYYLLTIWLLSAYYLVTICLLCGYYLVTMWLLFGYYLSTIYMLSAYFSVLSRYHPPCYLLHDLDTISTPSPWFATSAFLNEPPAESKLLPCLLTCLSRSDRSFNRPFAILVVPTASFFTDSSVLYCIPKQKHEYYPIPSLPMTPCYHRAERLLSQQWLCDGVMG